MVIFSDKFTQRKLMGPHSVRRGCEFLAVMMTMKQIVQLLIERGCQYSAEIIRFHGFRLCLFVESFSLGHFETLNLL